jgi:ribulose 1,5-bisphosphate carboxylase large subunit-like protein
VQDQRSVDLDQQNAAFVPYEFEGRRQISVPKENGDNQTTQDWVTRRFAAAAGAMSVFAAHIATAQSQQQQQRKQNTIYRISFPIKNFELGRADHEIIREAAAMMERDLTVQLRYCCSVARSDGAF